MNQENNYTLVAIDQVEIEQCLVRAKCNYTRGDDRGIFVELHFNTPEDYNHALESLMNRFGPGIFNDGEAPKYIQIGE